MDDELSHPNLISTATGNALSNTLIQHLPAQTSVSTNDYSTSFGMISIPGMNSASLVISGSSNSVDGLPLTKSMRETEITCAVRFLQHPSVCDAPYVRKYDFLIKKNLTEEEVKEAFKRAVNQAHLNDDKRQGDNFEINEVISIRKKLGILFPFNVNSLNTFLSLIIITVGTLSIVSHCWNRYCSWVGKGFSSHMSPLSFLGFLFLFFKKKRKQSKVSILNDQLNNQKLEIGHASSIKNGSKLCKNYFNNQACIQRCYHIRGHSNDHSSENFCKDYVNDGKCNMPINSTSIICSCYNHYPSRSLQRNRTRSLKDLKAIDYTVNPTIMCAEVSSLRSEMKIRDQEYINRLESQGSELTKLSKIVTNIWRCMQNMHINDEADCISKSKKESLLDNNTPKHSKVILNNEINDESQSKYKLNEDSQSNHLESNPYVHEQLENKAMDVFQLIENLISLSNGTDSAKRTIGTLALILKNLIQNPHSEKYRKINITPRFYERFGHCRDVAAKLLEKLGYTQLNNTYVYMEKDLTFIQKAKYMLDNAYSSIDKNLKTY